jgi:hypothetical protein
MTPSQLILKPSWDDKRPGSSEFAIGKEIKAAWTISGK